MAKEKTDVSTVEQFPPVGLADYAIVELVASAKEAFGVQPEVVIGALQFKYNGKQERFTKAEVKAAIKDFKAKEVK